MKKIKERTYITRLVSFIIGILIGWFFYIFVFASGSGEDITDKQNRIAGILSLVTMIIYEVVAEYNYLKKLELTTASLYSNISIYKGREKKLLSKAEEIISGFLQHESDIQKSVVASRGENSVKLINNKENISLTNLKVTVENYPNLKSDKHICKILNQLEDSQDTILNSKLLYNEYVTYYNSAIANFPAVSLSSLWKLKPLEFYVDDEFDEIHI
ncbi:LemA family protein [Clostridium botulinum]|uniref:LemA family protein n=1 Tax=Clostridium botulinum B str. Osaka05 TaxID=1407017 RepID=A0A0S6U669_CLOBO|nr:MULTISPECIES: LemA family protein [Clostridium]EJE7234415.1 LemA family protein [Clostridium botulinum]EKO1911133.1 LemA family protein [Clostridium botulinum]EKO2041194.1 LemA family protein [Clostridium botulinum]MBU5298936.1 LemA family protein [Clostridium sporogenes]NFE81409.1 LemA family protein [Clostridium sporogenes]